MDLIANQRHSHPLLACHSRGPNRPPIHVAHQTHGHGFQRAWTVLALERFCPSRLRTSLSISRAIMLHRFHLRSLFSDLKRIDLIPSACVARLMRDFDLLDL